MRNTYSALRAACALGLFAAILGGCASSSPSRFYQLSALSVQTVSTRDVPREGSIVVSVGPLRIPDYLDRPQIVTRSGKNELKLAEFDRWAGSIESDIIRVLVEDISAQLPSDRFFVVRWLPLLESQVASSYKVEIMVNRFEGTLGGEVSLHAQWALFGKEKQLPLMKQLNISEPVKGSSYEALVDAMSRALERLSREIAERVAAAGSKQPG